MNAGRYAKIIRKTSAVYMAAVMEYLVADVAEIARNNARDRKRVRITPRDISLAVRNDLELDKLWKDVTVAEGGVVPFIHEALLPKRGTKRSASGSASSTQTTEPTTKKRKKTSSSANEPTNEDTSEPTNEGTSQPSQKRRRSETSEEF